MPQMAPLSWLALFTIFSMTLIIFTIINYYSMIYPTLKKTACSKQDKNINWKW